MHRIGEIPAVDDGARRAAGIGLSVLLHIALVGAAWAGLAATTQRPPVPLEVRFIEAAAPIAQPVAQAAPALIPEPAPEPTPEPPAKPQPRDEPRPAPPVEPKKQARSPSAPVRAPQPRPKPKPKPREVSARVPATAAPLPEPRTVERPESPVAAQPSTPIPQAQPPAAAPAMAVAAPPALAAAAPAVPMRAPRFDAAYLRNPPPVYPRAARRHGEEGRVVLRVRVDSDGHPSRLELKMSSGSLRLDEAALEAVRRWRFVAARRGDDNVAAWVLVPIEFRLNDS